MLKLVTGLPGAGKTSNELWDFLNNKDYNGRPKYATSIKGFNPADHGVTPLEHIDQWRELPEGSVILCDEVQRYCGTDLGKDAPQWVQDFAIHRHSGKDFIFITQAPGFIHPFARKLVQPHVNYHRPYNLGRSMRYTWESVQTDPGSKTARNTGQSSVVKANPEVFKLYTSTVMDTHKAKPPLKSLIILGLAILVAVVCIAFAVRFVLHMMHKEEPAPEPVTTQAVVHAASTPIPLDLTSGTESKAVWTAETIKPRIAGQPYTAPVYDQLTPPTDFPRVAACMSSESRGSCNCYSQQGTPIDVPKSACLIFVKNGAFDPWFSGRNQQLQASNESTSQSQAPHENVASIDPVRHREPFTVVEDHSRIQRSKSSSETPK